MFCVLVIIVMAGLIGAAISCGLNVEDRRHGVITFVSCDPFTVEAISDGGAVLLELDLSQQLDVSEAWRSS